ncbi:Cyanide hydratase, partial [Tolypocladium capitatum]
GKSKSASWETVRLILEAGERGCKLIAFPEVWIPGYPYWPWRVNYADSLPFSMTTVSTASLRPDSDEMCRIRTAAREANIYVSLGYLERNGNSLYIAQVIIDPLGHQPPPAR